LKNLLVMRHAKSDRSNPDWLDIERPLTDRGRDDANKIGKFLKRSKIKIDTVISSSAIRAKETAAYFCDGMGLQIDILEEELFYSDNYNEVIEGINRIDNKFNTVVVIGHNPSFTDIFSKLCSDNFADIKLPTGGIYSIEFHMSTWEDSTLQGGCLTWFITPKLLRGKQK